MLLIMTTTAMMMMTIAVMVIMMVMMMEVCTCIRRLVSVPTYLWFSIDVWFV